MTDNAQAFWRKISQRFAETSFSPIKLWSIPAEGEEEALACRELVARGYIERAPGGWRLSAAGEALALSENPITTGAQEAFERIRSAYMEEGYPNYKTWKRTPGNKEEHGYFVELWTRGFLQPKDLSRTLWGLTDAGQRAIMQAS